MKMRPPVISIASAAILALAAVSPAEANLILNGGFESPNIGAAGVVTYSAGNAALAPWVINANNVDVVTASASGTPYEGTQFLDLDGFTPGQITQTFATIAGQEYVLRFAYANNAFGASASATVSVFSGVPTVLNQTITHSGSTVSNMGWTLFEAIFTALSTSTSLRFTSIADAQPNLGILLDAVSVNAVPAPAPEPSTWALFGCGLASLGGYRRISQRNKKS